MSTTTATAPISETHQPVIESFHWSKWLSADNYTCYNLTGIMLVDFKGNGSNWFQQTLQCVINIPLLSPNRGLHLRHWSPYLTLNSIYNHGQSVNSGFSVNRYKLINRQTNPLYGQTSITLAFDVAARDIDAYVHRIGFTVTLVGTEKPLPAN